MKALISVSATLAGLALLAWGAVAFPPSHRFLVDWGCYRAANKILHSNETSWARANVVPFKKIFAPPDADETVVDLGFAKFEVGSEYAPPVAFTGGQHGIWVMVKLGDFSILFLNPAPPEPMDEGTKKNVEASKRTLPKMAAFIQEMHSDEVAWQIEVEQVRPATFAQISAMNKDEYRLYCAMAQQKVLQFGTEKVFWFENAETKGIARFNLRDAAVHMLLSSSDGGKVVDCVVFAPKGRPDGAEPLVDQIAATFVFTIENIADREEIRRRILAAGIKPRHSGP